MFLKITNILFYLIKMEFRKFKQKAHNLGICFKYKMYI